MNRSLRHPVVTHVLAGLVGLGVVWLGGRHVPSPWSGAASGAPQRTSSGRPLPTVGQSLSSAGFRQVIEHLSGRDLTINERRDAMNVLFEEWVQRDPAGVLRFLDQVPHWPADLKWDSWIRRCNRRFPPAQPWIANLRFVAAMLATPLV